jgi:pyruvate dehydrogenase E1 component alpha subunit
MFAEIHGKADGYNKGKGGSMHIADTEIGMLGANGIVGGSLPMAAGAGLSAKVRGTDQVTVCFFGDGAANQGVLLESINIAAAYDLPVIYLCENNLYAVGTRLSEVSKTEDIAKRALGFGIEGKIVDGNDVIAVYDAVSAAVALARESKGPTLIECKTYRWCIHCGGAWDTSRDAQETEAWRQRDPIKLFAAHLIKTGAATEQQLQEIEANIEKEIDVAVEYARNSPQPNLGEATTDVYTDSFYREE